MTSDRLCRYAAFFAGMTPATVDDVDGLFCADARFLDPFNDVVGHEAIKAVFRHMFEQLDRPRFEILEMVGDADVGYFFWRFSCRAADGSERAFEGMSRVVFDGSGRVRQHTDYWDPTAPVYRQVPLLGFALDRVRQRLSAGQSAA